MYDGGDMLETFWPVVTAVLLARDAGAGHHEEAKDLTTEHSKGNSANYSERTSETNARYFDAR